MDRSAHVLYRKRKGAMEITVSRGIIGSEIKLLFAKLQRHRLTSPVTAVIFIKAGKKYRLGRLDQLDMARLRRLIEECLASYTKCGIQLVEAAGGRGAIYKPRVHSAKFKSKIR